VRVSQAPKKPGAVPADPPAPVPPCSSSPPQPTIIAMAIAAPVIPILIRRF
jgi:hypothetical protein